MTPPDDMTPPATETSSIDDLQQRFTEDKASVAQEAPQKEISIWTLLLVLVGIALLAFAGARFGPRIVDSFRGGPVPVNTRGSSVDGEPQAPARAPDSGPHAEVGDAFPVAPQRARAAKRQQIGMSLRGGFAVNEYGEDIRGAVVVALTSGGAAKAAGLQVGDTLVALDDIRVRTPQEFGRALSDTRGARDLRLRLIRGARTIEVTVRTT